MSTWSKAVVFAAFAVVCAWAQPRALDARSTMHITLPDDSPVALLSADWGESRSEVRGGAMVLDLHTSLSLRNATQRRIRGITLLVLAQEVTPGGKASVSVPSLDIGPGEPFPIRIDLQLLRPLQAGTGPLVKVELDGVLFADFGFYGPNKLNCRRAMTQWETEARRDRRHFKAVLEARGADGLRKEILEELAGETNRPQWNVRASNTGRSTNYDGARDTQLAFLSVPDAPVALLSGSASIHGSELRAPTLQIANHSKSAVRYVEVGWLIKGTNGQEVAAGSLPAKVTLAPGGKEQIAQSSALRFQRAGGAPLDIAGVTGYVSAVEFADGRVWVPSRETLDSPRLHRAVAPSPELQRLIELYRTKGLNAVIDQLNRY